MYVLSYQHILGYGQLLVLDESLSVLLNVCWYCCNCTCIFDQIKWWWKWQSLVHIELRLPIVNMTFRIFAKLKKFPRLGDKL